MALFGLDSLVAFESYPHTHWTFIPSSMGIAWTLAAELTFYSVAPWLLRVRHPLDCDLRKLSDPAGAALKTSARRVFVRIARNRCGNSSLRISTARSCRYGFPARRNRGPRAGAADPSDQDRLRPIWRACARTQARRISDHALIIFNGSDLIYEIAEERLCSGVDTS